MNTEQGVKIPCICRPTANVPVPPSALRASGAGLSEAFECDGTRTETFFSRKMSYSERPAPERPHFDSPSDGWYYTSDGFPPRNTAVRADGARWASYRHSDFAAHGIEPRRCLRSRQLLLGFSHPSRIRANALLRDDSPWQLVCAHSTLQLTH